MPSTARKKIGLLEQAEARTDAGRHVGLGFLDLHEQHTDTKARAIRTKKSGKAPRQPMPLKKAMAAMARHQVGRGRAADALDALGKGQVAAVAPAALTSRMIGLPATCRKVVPTPSRKMQPSSSRKLGAWSDGISRRPR